MGEPSSTEIQEEANASMRNVNANSKSQREANRLLADDITKMLERSEPPLPPECCIYRVPHDLRKLNEKAYTPQYVSIGPFHHGAKRLKSKEKLKVRYFKRFVKRAALNVEKLVSTVRNWEGNVRRYYAETSRLNSDNYVKMILVDASFIIVFFLAHSHECELAEWSSYDDFTAFTRRLMSIIFNDMCLLENQLPFVVIEELYKLAFASCSNYPSFTQLSFEFFRGYNTQEMPLDDLNSEIIHFVDLLRTFFLPPSHRLPKRSNDSEVLEHNDPKVLEHLYTASQLHEVGVKFKKGSSNCLFDLTFTNGVLKIPSFNYMQIQSLFFETSWPWSNVTICLMLMLPIILLYWIFLSTLPKMWNYLCKIRSWLIL